MDMDIDDGAAPSQPPAQSSSTIAPESGTPQGTIDLLYHYSLTLIYRELIPLLGPQITREIQVKVHIRRPERDSWVYMGRGIVSQEVIGQSSRVGMFLIFSVSGPLQIITRLPSRSCTSHK